MAIMGGTIGVAAVIDAGLESAIDITAKRLPSSIVISMADSCDEVIILNHGRSRESALRFGEMIQERVIDLVNVPVIQVDADFVRSLVSGSDLMTSIRLDFGLELLPPPVAKKRTVMKERIVGPLTPGDPVWVNGNVIGHALEERVIISIKDQVPFFQGLRVKETGLDRVKDPWDLDTMLIRGGRIDRSDIIPRCQEQPTTDQIHIIDHDAEGQFHYIQKEGPRPAYAVTIGDDTTHIASCLLYRLNVPILGITDGDEDGIMIEDTFHPDSMILRLAPSNDDRVGAELRDIYLSDAPSSIELPLNRLASLAMDIAGETLIAIRTKDGWSDVNGVVR